MIDAHRGAFEYDWRTRFGKSLRVVGRSMSWGESLRLTEQLLEDPSSRVAVSVAGWDYPATRELLAVMDAYDLTHQIAWVQGGKKGQRPKPYPRPWPDQKKERIGVPSVSQDQVLAALRLAGHDSPAP